MNHGMNLPAPVVSQTLSRTRRGRMLLVGARRRLGRLAHSLEVQHLNDLAIVGYVDLSGRGRQLVIHPRSQPVPILGRLEELDQLVERNRITDVVIALSERPSQRLRQRLASSPRPRVRLHWVNPNHHGESRPIASHSPAWPQENAPLWLLANRAAKRVFDFTLALAALLILFPLFASLVLLILCTSGRPVFYSQKRVGRNGRIFEILKFRSMKIDAERETGPIWASDHDERCTRIGEWLRHTNLDELPQLWNVLRGDMSLVGPRPERPVFVEQFQRELPGYDRRHAVPVGLTGWAQVHGWRGRTSLRKRLQYDLDYIRHWSFLFDLRVLLMTVQHVCVGRSIWGGGVAWLRRRERA